MNDKKVTDIMLDRIKYFINAIENGEFNPNEYEFTITLRHNGYKLLTISDKVDIN